MVLKKIDLKDDFFNEESRDGYLVSSKMKEIWAVELDLWKAFDAVCQEHQLVYYACGGTALGTVRHKGFIPWDDDMDIMMPREHYEKLCSIAENAFETPFFFQTEYTDPGTLRFHAQLRNSDTTAIIAYEKDGHYSFNQGIFLDIFPIDNVPDDERERVRFRKKLQYSKQRIHFIASCTSRYSAVKEKNLKTMIKRLIIPGIRILYGSRKRMEKLYAKHEKLMQKYNSENTRMFGILSLQLNSERLIWEKTDFSSIVFLKYEGYEMPLPERYENMLNKSYGNWKKYEIGTSVHGGIFFDVDKAYTEYI